MLGLSLTKVLFTILIVVVVWRGFALIGRLAREREVRAVRHGSGERVRPRGPGTVELVECRRCGTYFDPKQGCGCVRSRA